MTRQLTVKLKFEVEESGGRVTALLRSPNRPYALEGEGEDFEKAMSNLLMGAVARGEEFAILAAILEATQEAFLAALWTP